MLYRSNLLPFLFLHAQEKFHTYLLILLNFYTLIIYLHLPIISVINQQQIGKQKSVLYVFVHCINREKDRREIEYNVGV